MRLLAMSLIATGYLCCNAHVIKYTYDDSGNVPSIVGNITAHTANTWFGLVDYVSDLDGMLALSGVTKGNAAFTSHWKGLDHNQRWFEVDASYLGAKHFMDEERKILYMETNVSLI